MPPSDLRLPESYASPLPSRLTFGRQSLATHGAPGVFVELQFKDPNGMTFDLTEGGWPGTSR